MDKVVANAKQAIEGIKSGMTLMIGGFGVCGLPENAIAALAETDVMDVTCISNNAGVGDFGLGILLKDHRIKKMIASYVGENDEFERQMLSGESHKAHLPNVAALRVQGSRHSSRRPVMEQKWRKEKKSVYSMANRTSSNTRLTRTLPSSKRGAAIARVI